MVVQDESTKTFLVLPGRLPRVPNEPEPTAGGATTLDKLEEESADRRLRRRARAGDHDGLTTAGALRRPGRCGGQTWAMAPATTNAACC